MQKLKPFFKYVVSASFLGIVIGLVGLYYELRGSVTHMNVDTAGESNVLDVRHSMPDLSILFQGRDIEAEKSNLKVLTIRVVNDGSTNILENDFDSRTPFGILIRGGRVIRAQAVGGNSTYLSENINPRVEGGNQILLDKVIFDRGKFVTLEVLVLHPKGYEPTLRPLGKIAGLEQISTTRSFEEHNQRSFVDQVLSGPLAVQIARAIGYTLSTFMVVVLVGVSLAGLAAYPDARAKRIRKLTADRLPTLNSPEREKKREVIQKVFVDYGFEGLIHAQSALSDEKQLKTQLSVFQELYSGSAAIDISPDEMAQLHRQVQLASATSLAPLIAAKLLTLTGDTLEVDQDVRQLLNEYVSQIEGNRVGGARGN